MTPPINTRAARYLRLGEAYISAARGVLAAPDFELCGCPSTASSVTGWSSP